ncbi:HAD hydrolase-like protein [Mycetocola reblochoni]|uniref:Phosphoglycolate phosphatase n=2 Tax=Mycetocola reblochoni TaxID=331618 RepID=A0A1R4K3J1_9MICO|nr:HAD hydrolase-like protein [Mycetocola reblochoni]RLP67702.1 HAD family hydrolase [Mycetocola reblochoni]SJN38645.1 Phosphoglycolate phosphatase [Mycetocola reblochoni REB411]
MIPVETLSPWSVVFFDLDGTIVDSAPGITSRIAASLVELGHPRPTDAQLRSYVGPPILDGFRNISGLSDSEADEALRHYRSRVAEVGPEHDSALYPGVAEILGELSLRGIPLALSTSKPESQAVRILRHYGLTGFFTVICGASEDEVRSSKADVVAEAIRRLGALGIAAHPGVLVGDRVMDVEGAAAHGLSSILVRWGYGSAEEERGATAAVDTPVQLAELLGLAAPVPRGLPSTADAAGGGAS